MNARTRSLAASGLVLGAAVLAWVALPAAAQTITVPAGGDLQVAIDRARPGDTVTLAPGAVYTGNFVLPANDGDQFITIRTADDARHPRAGQRVRPALAGSLAVLRSPGRAPALRTAPGAHHWRLTLLELAANQDAAGDILALGDGGLAQHALSAVPHDLIVDRCYIHGDPERGQKRAIALNSGSTTISNSYISDIKAVGQDSQAIAGWNGPGPYTIENNYLEAAGDNFLLGGADPAIRGLTAQDVVFRRNHLTKRLEWRTAGWQVKNLFELKNARRVLVEGNVMENVWKDAQAGYAILLTPRNQDGGAPWVAVEDVTIRRNLVRHAGGGIAITGEDSNHPSGSTRRVMVTGNLFYDIDAAAWGGSGAFLLIGNGPADVSIEHNTVAQSGNILTAFGGSRGEPLPIRGLIFQNNLIRHNEFGVIGSDQAVGTGTLDAYFPGAVFRSNTIGGGDASRYPSGNTFIDRSAFDEGFLDPGHGDFRVKPGAAARGTASDGTNAGADLPALAAAVGARLR